MGMPLVRAEWACTSMRRHSRHGCLDIPPTARAGEADTLARQGLHLVSLAAVRVEARDDAHHGLDRWRQLGRKRPAGEPRGLWIWRGLFIG
jgi:hypothetical protein